MRKLLLVMVLVFCMASLAGAEVLYLTVVDVGASGTRDGSLGNELLPLDVVGISIWLTAVGPGNWYGGYWIDGLDISMDATGDGVLDIDFAGIVEHPTGGGRLYGSYVVDAVVETPTKVAIDGYASYNGWTPWEDQVDDGDLEFLTGFLFSPTAPGAVTVALNLDGPYIASLAGYAGIGSVNYASPVSGWWKYPGTSGIWPGSAVQMTGADLGSIVLNTIPEPFTLSILGLGGLALIRRRRS